VFRWQKRSDLWIGIDGGDTWSVSPLPDRLEVESNAPEAAFRRYFCLETPWNDVERQLGEAAPEIRPVLGAVRGLRLCRPASASETALCFLCTANNHLVRIERMVRFLESVGDEVGPGVFRFPSLEKVAGLPESKLRENGFGYRGASLPRAARAMVEKGPGWLERQRSAPYEVAIQELLSIPGIGPKLADCIALYGLHHDAAVPVDTHLWQAACRTFFPGFAGGSLTARRYREIGDLFRARFGDLAGWAQLLLYAENRRRKRAIATG